MTGSIQSFLAIITAGLFSHFAKGSSPDTGKMKPLTSILLLALSAAALAHPAQPGRREASAAQAPGAQGQEPATAAAAATAGAGGGVNPSLVPDFGVKPNTNPGAKQAGSCDGFAAASGAVTLIPCSCPPGRAAFLAALDRNVAAGQVQGTPVRFSNDAADQSAATNKQRATAMLVTLQNLDGAGKGCPAASAPNFAVQQQTGAVSSKVFVG